MTPELILWSIPGFIALQWICKRKPQTEETVSRRRAQQVPTAIPAATETCDEIYLDKLDGRIAQEFFERKSAEWRSEQESIRQRIETHETADQTYIEEGVKLIELAQSTVTLYEKQEMLEKRRLLNFVLSNSIWKDGKLEPVYRKPFNLLVDTNKKDRELRLVHGEKMDFRPVWLGD